MSQYNQAQLISASNATYVTNTSGLITAADVRALNSDWISSSALVNQSNTFTGDQTIVGNATISGSVNISGSITASLQKGYVWVGNGSNKSIAFATASLVPNINTGSFITGASVINNGHDIQFNKANGTNFSIGSFAGLDSTNTFTSPNTFQADAVVENANLYVLNQYGTINIHTHEDNIANLLFLIPIKIPFFIL